MGKVIMFEDILIPLLLPSVLGRVKGKTRFQKLVYLIQDKATANNIEGSSFTYELSHYGPFSAELSSVLEDLENRGFLKEEVEVTPAGYTQCVYSITEKGRRLLERSKKKALLSKKLIQIVRNIADEYSDVPLSELVDEAYRRYLR